MSRFRSSQRIINTPSHRIKITLFSIGTFVFWVTLGWGGIENLISFRSQVKAGNAIIIDPIYMGLFFWFVVLAWPSLSLMWMLFMRMEGRKPWVPERSRTDVNSIGKMLIGFVYLAPIIYFCFFKVSDYYSNKFQSPMAVAGYSECFHGKGKDAVVYFVLKTVLVQKRCPAGMTPTPQRYHNFN
jgi:hypothetical protein